MQEHKSSAEATHNLTGIINTWTSLTYIVGQLPEYSKYGWQMLTWNNVDDCLEPTTIDEMPCEV